MKSNKRDCLLVSDVMSVKPHMPTSRTLTETPCNSCKEGRRNISEGRRWCGAEQSLSRNAQICLGNRRFHPRQFLLAMEARRARTPQVRHTTLALSTVA
jgi:hypothetical protein